MKYIIVTGAERSGTTMINKWLGKNPDVFSMGEFRAIEITMMAMNCLKYQRKIGREKDIEYNLSIKLFREYIIENYKARGWDGEKVIVDKHPLERFNIDLLENLKELFPEIQFVYMLRDGRNVVKSSVQRKWGQNQRGQRSIEQSCGIWNNVINKTYDYARNSKNTLIIRYEHCHYADTTKMICNQLGLQYHEDFTFEVERANTDKVVKENDYKKYFNEEEKKRINSLLNTNLIKTGYYEE